MVAPAVDSSDEMLAAQAAAGDDHAFETLVSRYDGRVFRLACRLVSETDAPDILQETFIRSIATCRRSGTRRDSAPGCIASPPTPR